MVVIFLSCLGVGIICQQMVCHEEQQEDSYCHEGRLGDVEQSSRDGEEEEESPPVDFYFHVAKVGIFGHPIGRVARFLPILAIP